MGKLLAEHWPHLIFVAIGVVAFLWTAYRPGREDYGPSRGDRRGTVLRRGDARRTMRRRGAWSRSLRPLGTLRPPRRQRPRGRRRCGRPEPCVARRRGVA